MDTILVKYSEFFENDGGFDTLKKDFVKLGDELVDEANKIKKKVNDAFSFGDPEELEKQEKATEELLKTFKKFGDARESLNKVEAEFQKLQKQGKKATSDQIDQLSELDKNLNEYRTELKRANALEKQGIDTGEDLNKTRVEAQLNIKKTQKEIRGLQKEILESNELSKEEQKLLRARITLQKEEIENVDDLRARIAALRVVRNQTNITTEEGREQVRAYNQEIDQLTELLSDNSDKFIQNKINIGNYEESIVNALKRVNFFQGELSFLNGFIEKGIDLLTNSADANKKDAAAKRANAKATTGLTKTIRVLNRVAKATVILALVAAVASLASVFSQGRAGAIAQQRALARFTATARVVINVLAEAGKGLFQLFSGIFANVNLFFTRLQLSGQKLRLEILELFDGISDQSAKINETTARIRELEKSVDDLVANDDFTEGAAKIGDAFSDVGKRIEDAKAAIDTLDEAAIREFEIADEIRRAELNAVALRKEIRLLEIESNDSTISLNNQLQATERLLQARVKLAEDEADIALKQLELANARARADAQAAGFRLSADDVQFARDLLALNERLDERSGQNPLDDEALQASLDALENFLDKSNEVEIIRRENQQQTAEIQRDLFEQNLDLLIDLIDTEKNLSEQFVNDTTRNFQRRVNEFNRFLIRFRQNAQLELDEFTKFAEQRGLDLDFQVAFDENGNLQVFVNDTELAIDNIVELNDQLQGLGLNEITINRFREFIIESRNGVRDFRDLNKELVLVGINVRQLTNDLAASQGEIDALKSLQEEINQLLVRSRSATSREEREQILKDIEELEKRKTEIAKFGDFERNQNRKAAILEELKTVEEGSQRELELRQELIDIEKQLLDDQVSEALRSTEEAQKKSLEGIKKFADELNQIIGLALDKIVEVARESVEAAEERAEKQEEQVDRQEERARQGLENTLAFEQRALAEREAELVRQQRRQETLEKIKSLYASYQNYASRGDENPILKTLRDFAILESIAASFKEGGIVGVDGVKTNKRGITMGTSHNPNGRGGNLAWHERGEGFFSRKEVNNLGQDNFYKLKRLAASGTFDENFFSGQRDRYIAGIPVQQTNDKTAHELREVRKAIENKPVASLNTPEVVDGVLKFVETVTTKNKKKRNHFRIDKSSL